MPGSGLGVRDRRHLGTNGVKIANNCWFCDHLQKGIENTYSPERNPKRVELGTARTPAHVNLRQPTWRASRTGDGKLSFGASWRVYPRTHTDAIPRSPAHTHTSDRA